MPELHVLRVFCGEGGGGESARRVPRWRRGPSGAPPAVAAELGFSETVFVDDAERGEIRIFTPQEELRFAGHPVVGTAWLLARERGEAGRPSPAGGRAFRCARREG